MCRGACLLPTRVVWHVTLRACLLFLPGGQAAARREAISGGARVRGKQGPRGWGQEQRVWVATAHSVGRGRRAGSTARPRSFSRTPGWAANRHKSLPTKKLRKARPFLEPHLSHTHPPVCGCAHCRLFYLGCCGGRCGTSWPLFSKTWVSHRRRCPSLRKPF